MNIKEANEIMTRVKKFDNVSCSCQMFNPCEKCKEMPTMEEIKKAVSVLKEKIVGI